MPYSAQITRTNPACILFLIDQSGSIQDEFGASFHPERKVSHTADGDENVVWDLSSQPGPDPLPIPDHPDFPLRVETRTKLILDGAGGIVEQKIKFPVWYDAQANGKTPMCEAMAAAGLAIKEFVEKFPDAFPPIVLNLTDGLPSDGNPQANARLIRNLTTSDGATLLFNLLISSKEVLADYFPSDETGFTDNCSKLLFRMSSELPQKMWESAKAEGHDVKPHARGVVINADPTAIVRFLDIGTRITPSGR